MIATSTAVLGDGTNKLELYEETFCELQAAIRLLNDLTNRLFPNPGGHPPFVFQKEYKHDEYGRRICRVSCYFTKWVTDGLYEMEIEKYKEDE